MLEKLEGPDEPGREAVTAPEECCEMMETPSGARTRGAPLPRSGSDNSGERENLEEARTGAGEGLPAGPC